MIDISKIDWTKLLHPRYYFAVVLGIGLVLFLPEATITHIGLDGLRESTQPWLGLVWLISLALLATHALTALLKGGRDRWRNAQIEKQRAGYLHKLTDDEKAFLRPYIEQRTKSQVTEVSNGIVMGLARKRIVYFPSNVQPQDPWIDPIGWYGQVNLSDWAHDYLCSRPDLVFSTETPSGESGGVI